MSQIMIVRAKEGQLVSKNRVEGEFKEVVKKTVLDALSLWQLESADFTVIRDPQYPVEAKAPITKEQYDLYSKYDLQRATNGSVMFHLPVYIISFDNVYMEENYLDREVLVVAPYVDQISEEHIVELALESTKPPSEEDADKEGDEKEEAE
jgi:hypothetical protein